MSRDFKKIILILLLILNFFLWEIVLSFKDFLYLEVSLFDVSQGDSILIEIPTFKKSLFQNKIQILIDGGPSFGISEKVAKEMPFFDRKIEFLILTHPEKDHLSGLFEILEDFKVKYVFLPKIENLNSFQKRLQSNFLKKLKEKKIKYFFAKKGEKIFFDKIANLSFLWPKENFDSQIINEFSIVNKFSFGKIDFLFTGDITKKVEYWLLAENFSSNLLESEILKIPHHGSKYGLDEYFLKKVNPEIALISASKENPFGHPHFELLQLLKNYGINVFQTAKDGKIKILSDGRSYQIKKEK